MTRTENNDDQTSTVENSGNSEGEPKTLGFFQMVGSILSSFFGIQSSKKSQRDFKYGKASQFIMVGILMTIVWYGVISIIVNIVLANR